MTAYLTQVTALITRSGPEDPAARDLLILQHPTAGLQLPAGTAEEGEPPERAVLREAAEETGLDPAVTNPRGEIFAAGLRLVAPAGWLDEPCPPDGRWVGQDTPVYTRPEATSTTLARLRRGRLVGVLRQEAAFVQVIYTEGDRSADPTDTTSQVSGWVLEEALCAGVRRGFYHLALAGSSRNQRSAAPDRWSIYADGHLLNLFWAPLADLPELVYPQNTYLAYVRNELGYVFL